MFNNLHVEDKVKLLARASQLFCRYKLVMNRQSLLIGMELSDANILLDNIYSSYIGTLSRQSFA